MESYEITAQLMQLINQSIFLEKKRKFVYEGVALYPSEIHLMLETKGEQAVNATSIAQKLGITKGAVSQTLVRLQKKGIIEKTKDPFSKNELSITLTPLGKTAYEQHQKMFQGFGSELESIIHQYTNKEQEVIKDFLTKISGAFSKI